MDELQGLQPNSGAIQPPIPAGEGLRPRDAGGRSPQGEAFDVLLREQLLQGSPAPAAQGVKFSTHAQQRLQQRDITLGEDDVAKINDAVDRAQQKGAKESLILLDDMAFVVSVKNRVVITAVDQPSMKQNVFTNIDSVVIA
ncbi:MAG TPA: TIGR02530 family flagellar biosynthesis protein [Chloroflexota bacterium]|nr:TIGR02530 family flagellar biosynthesis protein [Chloroflexota bacterium]